jgi:uncharacterized protein (TIGR02271 family)
MNRDIDSTGQPHANRQFDANEPLRQSFDANEPLRDSTVIPVIEEQLQVGKKVVETGSVRINKIVREEEVTVETPVVVEKLDIERIPINQYVESAPPAVRYEGDVMIVPILEEVVVVEKRLRLVEELRITKRQEHTQVSQPVILRKEEVTVDRRDNPDALNAGTLPPGAASPNSNALL